MDMGTVEGEQERPRERERHTHWRFLPPSGDGSFSRALHLWQTSQALQKWGSAHLDHMLTIPGDRFGIASCYISGCNRCPELSSDKVAK